MTEAARPPALASTRAPQLLHLRSAGCSLLLELVHDRLPLVRHWGADLGTLDRAGAAGARLAAASFSQRSGELGARLASVVPEPWAGWMGRPGLIGSRQGRSWSTAWTIESVTVDGVAVTDYLERGAATVEVVAVDHEAHLRLALTIEMLPSGLVRLRGNLTNHGADYDVTELSLYLPVPTHATELLDFTGRWGMEKSAQRQAFNVGTHLRENRRGQTGHDTAYVVHATEAGSDFERGETWGVHTAWSGNHRHVAEHDSTGSRLLGGGELLLPGEVRLAAGESYETPWLFASYGEGLDAVAQRFHAYLRARPRHVDTERPVTLNVWEAVYFDHDADRLVELAGLAAEVGIERFVLDDGWFGDRRHSRAGLGDWTVSADAWPDGLHPLVDAVTRAGMQFGLWFEPEMVNLDSDLARAHPEWIMAARTELPIEQRSQHVLNLSIPECYDAILKQVLRILDEYDIGYIKWDHNRNHVEAGVQALGGAPGEHEQMLAVYRMMAAIKAHQPGLEIESCAGGGGRVDLGILEVTDRVWVSDCNDPLERQRLHRWTSQLIPTELMGSHIASPRSHTTGRRHDMSFRGATALFGHLGVEWDIASATPEEREELSEWIALYKRHRHLINSGTVFRGPDPDPSVWTHGVVAADRAEALFEIAALSWLEPAAAPHARLRGLEPERRYAVRALSVGEISGLHELPAWCTTEGVAISGSALMTIGLQVPSMDPEHSILAHVVAV
ncbi:alpha-galactosidase [Isoptericola hypogeus]|uniref:Alpha-galactosidase n=1 Tax=Isoptericola hypogeus TaxID=300179 RepID=A0ABP4VKD9_9MICO